ncbi:hypothetical protein IMG5_024480 [Ichthyophthirius multifiliis]|uniref:Uncharacterized protein n=1 Tax=Ichthyophthirius multifiliis TaxID=5932 RepID=G0QL21_ICHMU|nr:hypothetical protein IMG5_024480 [Ichthyophthirius multifiliis]EGR34077.1 hypothetical protein IMG5_024480 [Ichthyophthirius multifiliis]|eukprot:XP_004039381.1 hypothetical protein IMG5_024480 [Ichthyophthirius multifiliis]
MDYYGQNQYSFNAYQVGNEMSYKQKLDQNVLILPSDLVLVDGNRSMRLRQQRTKEMTCPIFLRYQEQLSQKNYNIKCYYPKYDKSSKQRENINYGLESYEKYRNAFEAKSLVEETVGKFGTYDGSGLQGILNILIQVFLYLGVTCGCKLEGAIQISGLALVFYTIWGQHLKQAQSYIQSFFSIFLLIIGTFDYSKQHFDISNIIFQAIILFMVSFFIINIITVIYIDEFRQIQLFYGNKENLKFTFLQKVNWFLSFLPDEALKYLKIIK